MKFLSLKTLALLAGMMFVAVSCFKDLDTIPLDKDVITCNAAISACEKGVQWQLALHLLNAMTNQQIDKNVKIMRWRLGRADSDVV